MHPPSTKFLPDRPIFGLDAYTESQLQTPRHHPLEVRLLVRALTILSFSASLSAPFAQQAAAPKMQLPADSRAYTAARAQLDPAARLAAMHRFLIDYPNSSRASRAQKSILDLLLACFPTRLGEIDTQAKLLIRDAGKGSSRIDEEAVVAQKLAEAGPKGIDLPLAARLAKQANDDQQEPAFTKHIDASFIAAKLPPPASAEVHAHFVQEKSEELSIVAEVAFHQGNLNEAGKFAELAFATDPTVDDTNSIRGEIALADHRDADALDAFERAQLYGGLRPELQQKMLALYRDAHNGSDAGFQAAQDARYAALFPPPFTPRPHSAPSGHTVLVELFTGSGCEPCVGADLAMDAMLAAYPRADLVVLALDQHIPLPDPLANPDSLARGKQYGVMHTPNFAIDGQILEAAGGDRNDSEDLYKNVTKTVDADAARSSGVSLQLTATLTPAGQVTAHASVTLPGAGALHTEIATVPVPPPPPDPKAAAKPVPTIESAAPAPTLNFALVEDDVRYAGENGIRFHRMVVRALAKPAGQGFPLTANSSATLDAAFQPADIGKRLNEYLDAYEQHNERFENTHFLARNTTLDPAHLKVVAWVEDAATHRVLQTAFVSLAPATPTGEAQ